MATHVLVIHGVGPFNEAATMSKIRQLLANAKYVGLSSESFSAFDWCRVVGSPFARIPSLAKAFLELVYIDPLQGDAPLYRTAVSVADALFLLCQLLSLALLPVLTASLVLKSRALIVGYLSIIVLLCLLACASEILPKGSIRAIRLARRIALIWAWPILHTVAAPVSLSMSGLSVIRELAKLLASLLFELVLLAIVLGLVGVVSPLHAGGVLGIGLAVTTLAVALAILAACAAVIYIVPRLFAYLPLKVVCDVVLWLHDSDYRAKLRSALRSEITDLHLDEDDTLILVTHSLGSIIALDYMVSAESRPRNYVLMTMGSPLRSLLVKFFPELFSSPAALGQFLRARNPNFEWINVYRRFDYIGRALGIEGTDYGSEMSTEQKTKFHMNYWDDRRVFECIEKCVNKLREFTAEQCQLPARQEIVWVPLRRSIRFTPAVRFWKNAPKVASASFFIVVFLSIGFGGRFAARGIWLDVKKLQSEGKSTLGVADCDLRLPDSSVNFPRKPFAGDCKITFDSVKEASKRVELPYTAALFFPDPEYVDKAFRCDRGGTCSGQCSVALIYDLKNPRTFITQRFFRQNSPFEMSPDACNALPAEIAIGDTPSVSDLLMLVVCTVIFGALSIPIWKSTGLIWLSDLMGVTSSDSWTAFKKSISRN